VVKNLPLKSIFPRVRAQFFNKILLAWKFLILVMRVGPNAL